LHPDEAWVTAQAESFVTQARDDGLRVRHVQHDRDTKFTGAFDKALTRNGAKVVRSPRMAPDCQPSSSGLSDRCAASVWGILFSSVPGIWTA